MKKASEDSVPSEVLSHAAKLQLKRDKFLAAREARKQKIQDIRANRKTAVKFRRSATPISGRRCCGRR